MRKILVALALTTSLAQAQMAEVLKSQYHPEKELGVVLVTDKEADSLTKAMADPNCRIICAQLSPAQMTQARADALLNWVRSGKSLWIYDAREAPLFGFKPALMRKEQFTNKPEEGTIFGSKIDGVATTAMALASHELLTGVGQVNIFMPPLGGDVYGALAVEGDTVPLLRFSLDSPTLCGMRREGRGAIVFKPLCWPEVLSGDRFQANLLEWCAGYQIPGTGGEGKIGNPPGPKAEYVHGKPAVAVLTPAMEVPAAAPAASPSQSPIARLGQDKLACNEGNLTGNLMNESLRFETGNESITVPRADVKSVVIGGSIDLDQLTTWDGKTRRGMLMTQKFEFEVDKDVKTIIKRNIQRLDMAPPK